MLQLVQNRKLGSKGAEITINGTIFDKINIEVMEVDHFKETYLVLSSGMNKLNAIWLQLVTLYRLPGQPGLAAGLAQPVERLTTEQEAAGWTITQGVKITVSNQGTFFAL